MKDNLHGRLGLGGTATSAAGQHKAEPQDGEDDKEDDGERVVPAVGLGSGLGRGEQYLWACSSEEEQRER